MVLPGAMFACFQTCLNRTWFPAGWNCIQPKARLRPIDAFLGNRCKGCHSVRRQETTATRRPRPAETRINLRSLAADALLLEVFQRAGVEGNRRAILHLV